MTFRRLTPGLVLGLAAVSTLLCGCAYDFNAKVLQYRQQASAGQTGCEPADNIISDVTNHGWHATCKGKTYVCSAVGEVACAPAAQ